MKNQGTINEQSMKNQQKINEKSMNKIIKNQ